MSSQYKSFKSKEEADAWFEKRRARDMKSYGISELPHLKGMNYEYKLGGINTVAVQKLYEHPRCRE